MVTEKQIWELFFTISHLFLFIGVFSILLFLKWVKPIGKRLFSAKWKWLVAPN
jgi:hypothetical protein